DLKTFAAHGVYGTSAITALTAQNTLGVSGILPATAEFVTLQIEAIAGDLGCDAVKTGMLGDAVLVEAVAAAIAALDLPNLVVDPVMVAKSGDHLLPSDAVHALRVHLLPLARVVTPNIPEAGVLAGMSVTSLDDAREAARRIHALGPDVVIVKGGHLDTTEVVDLVFDGTTIVTLTGPRVAGPHTHGTGCTFAAAIAARLAQGADVEGAARAAKAYVEAAMRRGIPLGRGHRPLDHFASGLLPPPGD
ncbi:MAG: bifunctional hydroxymethylpyrimidine kinase/phosphomethylpyrimidine kinase, partial [Vicinamibacteria bacterium]